MPDTKQVELVYVVDQQWGGAVSCAVYKPTEAGDGGRRHVTRCHVGKLLRSNDITFVSPRDRRILMQLSMSQTVRNDSEIILKASDGHSLLLEIIATGRGYWSREGQGPLTWGGPRQGQPRWDEQDGIGCRLQLDVSPKPTALLSLEPPVYVDEHLRQCGPVETNLPDEAAAAWTNGLSMNLEEALQFSHRMLKQFPGIDMPLPGNKPVDVLSDIKPTPFLTLLHREFFPLTAGSVVPVKTPVIFARLEFDYDGQSVHHAAGDLSLSVLRGNVLRQICRDGAMETAAYNRLTGLGFAPLGEVVPGLNLRTYNQDLGLKAGGRCDWYELLKTELEKLESEGWQVRHDRDIKLVAPADDAWYSEVKPSGTDWFDFEAGFTVNGVRVNLLPVVHQLLAEYRGQAIGEIQRSLECRSLTIPVGKGTLAVVPGCRLALILRNLFELFDTEPLQKDGRLRVNHWRVAEMTELEKLSASPWQTPEKIRKLARSLSPGFTLEPRPKPRGFRGKLRPYQKLGLAWLQFLREHEFDGVLADDMGLGKTIQALAHLVEEKRAGRLDKPCLVVAPTSLMANWANEAARFTPGLSVLVLHGPDRKAQFDRIDKAHLVLTTYALLRWDADVYRDREFSYVILDEAQFIKNHKAQVTQLVRGLRCRRRLCMTGTPMENHLGELWSLFHFLMPGFLGGHSPFRTRFRVPIEKDGNDNMREILSKRVAPFLLRRTKEDVAPELPPRTEIVQAVELSEYQRDLYETVRLAVETDVRKEISKKGVARSQIMILHALLKLRQICCDPRLAKPDADMTIPDDSGKLAALMGMLTELIEEGRHILVFSQFTSMLKLIQQELKRKKLRYVLLTGSTSDRATPVERFQDGDIPLFLISLRAGGTGLNLTAADTVIHYDPWWNPAVEKQATDRAHRIGQDKPVFVYKLITTGTVEAKILELQQRKQALVQGVLSKQSGTKISFDKEDLERLFAPIG